MVMEDLSFFGFLLSEYVSLFKIWALFENVNSAVFNSNVQGSSLLGPWCDKSRCSIKKYMKLKKEISA